MVERRWTVQFTRSNSWRTLGSTEMMIKRRTNNSFKKLNH
jgi:hypothetical protein